MSLSGLSVDATVLQTSCPIWLCHLLVRCHQGWQLSKFTPTQAKSSESGNSLLFLGVRSHFECLGHVSHSNRRRMPSTNEPSHVPLQQWPIIVGNCKYQCFRSCTYVHQVLAYANATSQFLKDGPFFHGGDRRPRDTLPRSLISNVIHLCRTVKPQPSNDAARHFPSHRHMANMVPCTPLNHRVLRLYTDGLPIPSPSHQPDAM